MNGKTILLFLCIAMTVSTVQSAFCTQCVTLVGAAEDWLQKGSSEQEIESKLKYLCSKIPAFEGVCEQVVEKEYSEWIKLLERRATPLRICSSIGFCAKNSSKVVQFEKVYSQMVAGSAKPKTLKCEICGYLIGALVAYADKSTQPEDLKKIVNELCKLVQSFEFTCDALASQNLEAVFDWIFTQYNSQFICTKIGVCDSPSLLVKDLAIASGEKKPFEPTCFGCRFVVEEAQHFLQTNQKVPAIVKAASNRLCHLLQEKYRDTCNAFIQMEEPTLVNLLASQNSQVVCKKVGLCQ
eukprot:TRINITY_DN2444_c0_g1_i1.p1 TRINITY_DN2444_c0_g1~~TRINITY_DN2444_c0_g1_i1.p1  ORF type:complete len:296 (+),score=103.97 TRINITY_DN2444_c0_g1_i1:143-1030(+)